MLRYESAEGRYDGLPGGRFQRKASLDADRWSGELRRAVDRAKDGDEDAVRYLYLRFAGNVYGYALSIVANEHDAEDITQQVFTRLITAIGGYEHRSVPFSAWILRVTRNMCVDHLRRRTVACEEIRIADEGRDDLQSTLSTALRDALAELPAGQRQVVMLRHVAGYAPADIASALGKSEDAVHGLHHRGRRALQEALRRRGAVPVTAMAS